MKKFKNQIRRSLSLAVALSMCLGTLQVTALAEDEPSANSGSISTDADGKETYTTSGGTEIAVKSDKTETDSDGNVTHVEGSYTDKGVEKDVAVDIGRGDRETTEGSTEPGTINDSTVTNRDDQDRPTQAEGEKTEQQTTTETVTETSKDTQYDTSDTKTELGEKKETTEKGELKPVESKPEPKPEPPKYSSDLELDKNDQLEVKVDAKPGNVAQWDQKGNLIGGVTKEKDLDEKGQLAKLKQKVNEKADAAKDKYVKDEGYQSNPETGRLEKDLKDSTGKVIGKQEVEVKVVPTADGKGYQMVTTVTKTTYGDTNKTDTTKVDNDPDKADKEFDFVFGDEPNKTEMGTKSPVEGFDRTPVSSMTPVEIPEGAEAITSDDDPDVVIGYRVVESIPVVDPVTGEQIGTETQTREVHFQVTETVADQTKQEDKYTYTADGKIEGVVTEVRKDQVTIEMTTEESTLKIDENADALKVTIGMDDVTRKDGDKKDPVGYEVEVFTTMDYNGRPIPISEKVNNFADKDDMDGHNNFNPDKVATILGEIKDKLSSEVTEDIFAGATVNVTQSVCNGAGYKGTMDIKLNISRSQLDNSSLVLKVTRDGKTESITIGDDYSGQYGEGIKDNGDGTVSVILGGIGSSANIGLQLTGKVNMANKVRVGDKEYQVDQLINYETAVLVSINEVKAEIVDSSETKAFTREDTVTSTQDKTLTATQTKTETITTIETITASTDTWTTEWNSQFVYDDDDDDDDDNGGGTTTPGTTTPGGGTGTTGTVTVAEGPVPLAEAPEVVVPEAEVPLAEAPAEMEIPEEAVPLADSTEVVIADDAVPLADVPKTGDISNLWYAAALLSACGLAVLNGKKREEEDA